MIDPLISAHYVGDCRKLLRRLPSACVQTCITSPPYWGLRDYNEEGQIGLEDTPEKYVEVLVDVFKGVWRVLKEDGTLWLNLGDSYSHGGCGSRDADRWPKQSRNKGSKRTTHAKKRTGLKPKDLVGIPWMVAFALRDAGWYLRMDNIWSKPNPMPESVTDRTTKAHEYLFHFAKSPSYYYNADVLREPQETLGERHEGKSGYRSHHPSKGGITQRSLHPLGANKRSVWEVPADVTPDFARAQIEAWTRLVADWEAVRQNKPSVWPVTPQPYHGAHFATFPPDLIEPCILACSRVDDLVLDPFFGTGTTGMVAELHERRWIGFDISDKYAKLAKERTAQRSLPLASARRKGE